MIKANSDSSCSESEAGNIPFCLALIEKTQTREVIETFCFLVGGVA
jgi:hypothetical protein